MKSRCPKCYAPADTVCPACRCTIIRNQRGEADYAYQGTQMVYQRRANSHIDDGGPRAAQFHRSRSERSGITTSAIHDERHTRFGTFYFKPSHKKKKGAA